MKIKRKKFKRMKKVHKSVQKGNKKSIEVCASSVLK